MFLKTLKCNSLMWHPVILMGLNWSLHVRSLPKIFRENLNKLPAEEPRADESQPAPKTHSKKLRMKTALAGTRSHATAPDTRQGEGRLKASTDERRKSMDPGRRIEAQTDFCA